MVIYLEGCESGSMFEEFGTCVGDLHSFSWMEDCDANDLCKEIFGVQYGRVRNRTEESHVMKYGDMSHIMEFLLTCMGGSSSKS
ncbi:hypothetical protein M0R45_026972 [Rubus argutus]|uniref:Legumain n=1 Tax=Rubus argutus TaxID=59490 RepID=A0AAW1WYZ5_RUBAR